MSDLVERLLWRRTDGTLVNPLGPEAADRIEALEKALRPFADESLWSGPQHEFVTVKRSDCDTARAALEQK